MELELYGRCFSLHLSCHQLEVEDIDMLEVEGTNMVQEHNYPMNHQLEEEGMNMLEEYYHLTIHRLEVKDMDIMGIHMWRWGYGYSGGAPVKPSIGGGVY
jgi:hypothetical protein